MRESAGVVRAAMMGVSLAMLTQPALGQVVETSPAPGNAGTAGSVVDNETDDGAIQDIVVTAQRRAANRQDVPIAVTAATMAEARVENIANISAITPSVTCRVTNNAVSSSSRQIRGVATKQCSRAMGRSA